MGLAPFLNLNGSFLLLGGYSAYYLVLEPVAGLRCAGALATGARRAGRGAAAGPPPNPCAPCSLAWPPQLGGLCGAPPLDRGQCLQAAGRRRLGLGGGPARAELVHAGARAPATGRGGRASQGRWGRRAGPGGSRQTCLRPTACPAGRVWALAGGGAQAGAHGLLLPGLGCGLPSRPLRCDMRPGVPPPALHTHTLSRPPSPPTPAPPSPRRAWCSPPCLSGLSCSSSWATAERCMRRCSAAWRPTWQSGERRRARRSPCCRSLRRRRPAEGARGAAPRCAHSAHTRV